MARSEGPRRRGGLVCETRAGASSSRPKAEPATEGRRFLSLSKGGDLAEASRREQFRQRCEAVLRPELRQKKCRRHGPSGKFNCSVQAAPGGRRGGGVRPSSSTMRTRLTRRGSASSTWNSKPGTACTTSPRAGTRPSALNIRPPIVSTYSPCSPRRNPRRSSWRPRRSRPWRRPRRRRRRPA